VPNPLTKLCTKCSETKPLIEFRENPMGRLGRHSQCLMCQNKLSKDRYYADLENNRAKRAASAKRRRAEHKAAGGISPDYLKFATQQPEQLARVTAILERSSPRQAQRFCLQILNSGQDQWRRFRVSWSGDELLSHYSGI